MSDAALTTEWARLLLGMLAQSGVREAVISPGSRSTPFTFAALREPTLRCHDIVDERSAAFFALGQAKVSGEPTLLLCTSGSAAANYLPAVVEANNSHTPLLILTADRPLELQDCSAHQTIDQNRLFGQHARAFFELGAPDAAPSALAGVARIAAQACLRSRSPVPGAVHLNARARKPLEPVTPAPDSTVRRAVDALLERGPTRSTPARVGPPADGLERLAAACQRAERGVIIAGPRLPGQPDLVGAVAELARRSGFVVFPEAPSQLRFGLAGRLPPEQICDGFDALLRARSFAFEPDLVLELGPPPVSGGYERWLARQPRCARYVLAEHGFPDPSGTAAEVVLGALDHTLSALLAALPSPAGAVAEARCQFAGALGRANARVWEALEQDAAPELDERRAVELTLASLPEGALLALGNSLPIREVDVFCRAVPRPGIQVLCQRGASGIDGLVSSAAGAAARSGRPTTLLLGDISFLHDLGGLWAARRIQSPLAVVILNNQGGRIFEQLPLGHSAALRPGEIDHWTTPHALDLARAGDLFGIPSSQVNDAETLSAALAAAHGRAGPTVIEVQLPGDRTTAALERFWRRVEQAFERAP